MQISTTPFDSWADESLWRDLTICMKAIKITVQDLSETEQLTGTGLDSYAMI